MNLTCPLKCAIAGSCCTHYYHRYMTWNWDFHDISLWEVKVHGVTLSVIFTTTSSLWTRPGAAGNPICRWELWRFVKIQLYWQSGGRVQAHRRRVFAHRKRRLWQRGPHLSFSSSHLVQFPIGGSPRSRLLSSSSYPELWRSRLLVRRY